jgi:hypothetical protein
MLSQQTNHEWNVGNLKVPQYSGEISLPLQTGTLWPFYGRKYASEHRPGRKLESVSRGQGGTDSFDEFAQQRSNVNEFLEESFPTWLLTSFYLAAARRQRAPLPSLPDLWR